MKIQTSAEYNGHSFWARVEAPEVFSSAITVNGRKDYYAKGKVEFTVNWPAIGSQDADTTRAFAALLKHAAELAARLQWLADGGRLTLEEVAREFFEGAATDDTEVPPSSVGFIETTEEVEA